MFKNLSSIKKGLQERRQKIKKELEQVAKKSSRKENGYEARFPEYGRAEDENAEEVATFIDSLSLGENLERSLKDVEQALERINKGKYGICEACGKKISEKRLKILPATQYCLPCKQDRVQGI